MRGFRPEFTQGLEIFAKISLDIEEQGFQAPILVGGAAVELYSQSAIATGDFDIVSSREDILEQCFIAHGFEKPSGAGQSTRGWIHKDLQLGFEIVGYTLLDGNTDAERLQLIEMKEGVITVIAIEDLIADRMGQYASGTADEFLQQAKTLFTLYKDVDLYYMENRIRRETDGQYGVKDLENSE